MAQHDENLGVEQSPMERSYAVVLEPETEGGYSVSIPALPEAHTQGETNPPSRGQQCCVSCMSRILHGTLSGIASLFFSQRCSENGEFRDGESMLRSDTFPRHSAEPVELQPSGLRNGIDHPVNKKRRHAGAFLYRITGPMLPVASFFLERAP